MKRAPTICVRNLQRKIRVDAAELEPFARRALERVRMLRKKPPSALQRVREISILLVGNRRMASLHRRFLGEPGPTDVLTFEHGEIFIAPEVARAQARQFGQSLGRELRLYIVHGLLHLHGFSDTGVEARRKMQAAEAKVLRATL